MLGGTARAPALVLLRNVDDECCPSPSTSSSIGLSSTTSEEAKKEGDAADEDALGAEDEDGAEDALGAEDDEDDVLAALTAVLLLLVGRAA